MTTKSEDHLPSKGVRPRFKIETDNPAETISANIKQALDQENATCIGTSSPKFISLRIPSSEQHYWSPQLSITIAYENDKTVLRGVYGPRPTVWTMFVFFYALIGLALLVVMVIGLSTMTLDKGTMVFWWIPALLIVFLSLYLVAYFGQKLGHNQMVVLQSFFEETTGLEIDQSS